MVQCTLVNLITSIHLFQEWQVESGNIVDGPKPPNPFLAPVILKNCSYHGSLSPYEDMVVSMFGVVE